MEIKILKNEKEKICFKINDEDEREFVYDNFDYLIDLTYNNDEVVNIAQSHFFYVATAEGDSVFDIKNLPVSFGLVLGNEANGVSTEFKNIGKKISLPMSGAIERLNVSVAAGVFMYYFSHFGL